MVLSKEQLLVDSWGKNVGESGYFLGSPPDAIVSGFPGGTKGYDAAVQPNGIDLSLAKVEEFADAGSVTVSGKRLPKMQEVKSRSLNGLTYYLQPGTYFVTFNETVKLPNDVMAYTRPRSTLLRCGVALHTAVWDAGYEGKGGSLLVVYNEAGFFVEKNARIAQMVFHRLEQPTAEGYNGSYQREGLDRQIAAVGEAIKNGPLFTDPPEYERADYEDSYYEERVHPVVEALRKKGWGNVMDQNPKVVEQLSLVPDSTTEADLQRIDAAFAKLNPNE